MKDHDLLTAHFTDNERTNICSLWVSNETSEIHEMHIECKDGDHHFEDLITHISLDDIHENTYKFMQQQSEELQNTVIDIAKKSGWIYDLEDLDTQIYKAVVKAVFLDDFDPIKHKEQLFFLKMELFETNMVKNGKDRELKKQLRLATDLISCIEAACKIYRKSLE
jgi:hypothetical protein